MLSPADAFPALTFLSLIGSVAVFAYLYSTESQAPKFQFYPTSSEVSKGPKISIIVTAKNEEDMIESCLRSLTNQTYSKKEIIAVDDSSTDRTKEIILRLAQGDPVIRFVSAGTKPDGWVGKSWPCWRGFEESSGDYLLFVDADSLFAPETVERTVLYAFQNSIDIFSLSPRVKYHGIWARAVLPMITGAINLLYPMKKVNDKRNERAYVFGTYFLIKKDVYAKTEGHRKVRDQIVEDAAIARLVKAAGYDLRIERGTELLSTEWESEPRAIFHGLERVASSSIKSYGMVSVLNAVLLFFLIVYPVIFIFATVLSHSLTGIFLAGLVASLANVAVFLALTANETREITGGTGGLGALLYFLGGSIFMTAIITTSIKVARGKDLYWKGQRYKQVSPIRMD
jgi:chlorobactene glucosyltransferase